MLYEDIVPKLYSYVPLAPFPAMLDAVQGAAVDFCKRSNAHRYTVPAFDSVVGQHFYTLATPAGTIPCKIITGRFNKTPLYPTSSVLLNETQELLTPRYYQLLGAQVRVTGSAPVAIPAAFEFEIAVTPAYASNFVTDSIFDEYWEAIIDGALARLYSIPGKEWSSPRDAAYRQSLFDNAISVAEGRANADNTAKRRVCSYGG